MKKRVNRNPSRIAVFGKNRMLAAVFSSQTQAAHMLGVGTSTVCYASRGRTENCHGWYFREPTNVTLEAQDFGTLTLDEFDMLNGSFIVKR